MFMSLGFICITFNPSLCLNLSISGSMAKIRESILKTDGGVAWTESCPIVLQQRFYSLCHLFLQNVMLYAVYVFIRHLSNSQLPSAPTMGSNERCYLQEHRLELWRRKRLNWAPESVGCHLIWKRSTSTQGMSEQDGYRMLEGRFWLHTRCWHVEKQLTITSDTGLPAFHPLTPQTSVWSREDYCFRRHSERDWNIEISLKHESNQTRSHVQREAKEEKKWGPCWEKAGDMRREAMRIPIQWGECLGTAE